MWSSTHRPRGSNIRMNCLFSMLSSDLSTNESSTAVSDRSGWVPKHGYILPWTWNIRSIPTCDAFDITSFTSHINPDPYLAPPAPNRNAHLERQTPSPHDLCFPRYWSAPLTISSIPSTSSLPILPQPSPSPFPTTFLARPSIYARRSSLFPSQSTPSTTPCKLCNFGLNASSCALSAGNCDVANPARVVNGVLLALSCVKERLRGAAEGWEVKNERFEGERSFEGETRVWSWVMRAAFDVCWRRRA